jgi:hypothetical protein
MTSFYCPGLSTIRLPYRNRLVRRVGVALGSLATAFTLFGQQPDSMGTALLNLRKAILEVQRTTTQDSEEDKLSNQLIQSHQRLSSQWREAGSPNIDSDYLRSLQFDIDQLTSISGRPSGVRPALVAVNRDLDIKTRFSKTGANASAGFSDKVTVTVRTFRANAEVSGYLIRCNPDRWADSKLPFHVFSSASSPTTASLPPGYYTMWAEDVGGRVIASRPITVGDTSASRQDIAFPLP